KRPMLEVPLLSPRLSAAWVSLVAGIPIALAKPLVQSLECPMVARDRRLQELAGIPGRSFDDALDTPPTPTSATRRVRRRHQTPNMRAVHRMTVVDSADARAIGRHYPRWLARALRWVLWHRTDADAHALGFRGTQRKLFELTPDPEANDADQMFVRVTGGWLSAGPNGHLELRILADASGRRTVLLAIV